MLISAPELVKRIENGETFVPIDVRERGAWETATLPGALSLNVYDYFVSDSTPKGYAAMAGAFVHAWQQLGIASGATPVFFEQTVGMRSPRGLWFLWFALGAEGLILDGGIEAWVAAGGKLAPGTGPSASVSDTGAPDYQPTMPQLAATRAEAIDADPASTLLLDARRPTEYDGSFVHECCARAGRIPGSKLLFWEDVVENGRFKSAAELARLAIEAGFTPSKRVITWCHRGARAATVLVALKLAGYEDVAVYVGSWHEWASHRELPLISGE